MRHHYTTGALAAGFLVFGFSALQAQDLSPIEIQGRNLINQNCAVCHLKPQLGAKTYGPALNRDTLGSNVEAIRDFVSVGTQRMPGFRHRFTPAQIDSIAAYLKTVPATPAATPASAVTR